MLFRSDFFYIDTFVNFDSYLNNIFFWFKKIQDGGIILGSRYFPPFHSILNNENDILPINTKKIIIDTVDIKLPKKKNYDKYFYSKRYQQCKENLIEYEIDFQISVAVDQFSKMISTPPLVTYVDFTIDSCSKLKNSNQAGNSKNNHFDDDNNNNYNDKNNNHNNDNNNNNNNDNNNNIIDNNEDNIYINKNNVDINCSPAWYVIKSHTR